MNNESNPDNVFKPKKTPLIIGAVLLVLIVAIIVLSVFLLTRGGSGENTTPSTPSAGRSDPVLSNPQTTPTTPDTTDDTVDPTSSTTSETPSTTPDTSGEQTSQQTSTDTPSITTTERQYNKADPSTFSETKNAESIGRGSLILVDEIVRYTFPADKLISRTEMAKLSSKELKDVYNFVQVASSEYFVRKSNTLYLNAEAYPEFVNMMNAFAAATGNKNVQLRNAYYYDKTEQVCYNATGLYVDLEININDKIYPLNYETLKADYYDWFVANSYRFGYIHVGENYSSTGQPQYSTFRYIGIPHATFMHDNGIDDLETYLDRLESYAIEKQLTITDSDGVAWLVYYVPATAGGTEIKLTATPGSYTISGNNTDGYIVTINTAYFK